MSTGCRYDACLRPFLTLTNSSTMPPFKRAGAIEGVGGDDVGEAVRLHLDQEVADAGGLELEDALGLAALEELEGLGVVEREACRGRAARRGAAALMSRTAAASVVRLRRPRKSIFSSPAFSMSPISHWVVTTSLALSLLGSFWSGTSSSSGRSAITTPAACVPTLRFIPSSRRAKSSSRATSGSSSASRCSAGSSLIASSRVMFEPGGDQLVDLLDAGQRDVQHPADVLDRRLGLERAEGADLGDVGVAVLVPDVLDHLVAALLAEVDVDVGRLGAIGVEEPLEEQVVLERADVAELEHVADEGAAGRAAGQRGDASLAGVADEVPDDQEVRGEPHPVDDAQLVVEPLADLAGRGRRRSARAGPPRRARAGSPRASCRSGGLNEGK